MRTIEILQTGEATPRLVADFYSWIPYHRGGQTRKHEYRGEVGMNDNLYVIGQNWINSGLLPDGRVIK